MGRPGDSWGLGLERGLVPEIGETAGLGVEMVGRWASTTDLLPEKE